MSIHTGAKKAEFDPLVAGGALAVASMLPSSIRRITVHHMLFINGTEASRISKVLALLRRCN